jgi:hypothetical protein
VIKIVPPHAWGPGDGLSAALVKASAAGFGGADFGALVKRAGHPLAEWVRHNRPAPGETYVHAIALGSTETIGPNRNADGYPNVMLARDWPTFEKYAYFYRDHRNTSPELSYGRVKKAYYNPVLQRIETISALNQNKEAAARNGGGNVADWEHELLESGRDIAVSQSVKVPYDECSGCGHKARTRAEYCRGVDQGGTCKYGGCQDNLGRVFDNGFHLYVENPKGTFFDLSNVTRTRGADRTAFVTGKVAAAERVVGGAELAEMMNLVAPEYLLAPQAYAALRCLRKLAAAPAHPHEPAPWGLAVGVRAALAGKSAADLDPPAGASDADRHARIGDLARAGVVLSPPAWLAMATGVAAEKCAAVFGGPVDPTRDLLERADLHEALEAAALAGDSRLSGEKWAWAAATPKAVEREAALAVLAPAKTASDRAVPPAVRAEARTRYAAYQANLLAASENSPKFDLLLSECARQNRNLSA